MRTNVLKPMRTFLPLISFLFFLPAFSYAKFDWNWYFGVKNETKMDLPVGIWKFPEKYPTNSTVSLTKDQLKSGLQRVTNDAHEATRLADKIFEYMSQANDFAALLIGENPLGAIITGAIDAAIQLGQGITQIIDKVRDENGTNLATFNAVPNSKLELVSAYGFDDKLINGSSSLLDINALNSMDKPYAACTTTKMGGIVLNMMPYGSKVLSGAPRGGINGKFSYRFIAGGRTYNLSLLVENWVGAGTMSTYQLSGSGMSALTVSSNRKENSIYRTTTLDGKYEVSLHLRHAKNDQGSLDQRKDVVVMTISPKPMSSAPKQQLVELVHQGGYVANFQVHYNINGSNRTQSFNSKRAGWKYTYQLPAGAKYIKVSAQSQATARKWVDIMNNVGISSSSRFTVKGTANRPSYTKSGI